MPEGGEGEVEDALPVLESERDFFRDPMRSIQSDTDYFFGTRIYLIIL